MHHGRAGTPVQTKKKRINFVQINVDRRSATYDVVERRARRDGVDVLLLGEPNKRMCDRKGWLTDVRRDAAIVLLSDEVAVCDTGSGDGYAWAELSEMVVYSCYCSPNVGLQTFEQFINKLDADVKTRVKQVVIGGDFNAKAAEWGSPTEDKRGAVMTEWLNEANLTVLNRGNKPTFVRNGRGTYIDVTLCSEETARKIKNWRVLDEETLGCHRMIEFRCMLGAEGVVPRPKAGWRINEDTLKLFQNKFGERAEKQLGEGNRPEYGAYLREVTKC